MYDRIKRNIDNYLRTNKNSYNLKCYSVILNPLIFIIQMITKIRVFMFVIGLLLILITTLITLLQKVKEKNSIDEDLEDLEMENSEINEMLSYRYVPRVIVPIIDINVESISALRLANTISDDITIFGIFDNANSYEKIKEEFKLLDVDITVVIKHLVNISATEQLLEFIESAEYNISFGECLTVILPRSASSKSLANFLKDQTKIYIKKEIARYRNIIVITMP